MKSFTIKNGLDLPITGKPKTDSIESGPAAKTVAIVGPDYVGMKPTMLVQVGDEVKIGQPLFECKKTEGLVFTSPGGGKVVGIHRGERRAFQSIVVELSGNEEHVSFSAFKSKSVSDLTFEDVRDLLQESGLWTALRRRPFSSVPALDSRPEALFITATDSNPNSADPMIVLKGQMEDFQKGVKILSLLTEGTTYVCRSDWSNVVAPEHPKVELVEFGGPHPSGNVGTHIHFLHPVSAEKTVWHIGYQDVVAVAKLFETGRLHLDRVVAVGGPKAKSPRYVKTRVGADFRPLVGDTGEGVRVVSGSVFNGRKMEEPFFHLSRYANQISVLEEGTHREFLGWKMPGFKKFSVSRAFASTPMIKMGKKFPLTTTTHGSFRAMVPIGLFEEVMPLDILPTQLLRAIMTQDTELAQQLGALELDEEDLALCTFVSPGKDDFGPILRENLTTIEKEG